jgi:DNA primase
LIKPETIQEIFETVRVDEVVGEFVSLKKRGVNMIGLCPFHNEKTPSFTVSPAKGIYKCFGCGKGGNAVNFIMDHEHYTYPEALKFLAKKYNIDIEEEEQTPEQLEYLNEQESLFHVSTFAREYFTENLQKSEEGKAIGLSYLLDRGISEAMIEKFQLGYCIDKFEDFTKHALKEGYKQEYLEKTGLCIRKEDRVYDRFRGRVMFPIHSLTGRVIAFGGRILSAEKSKAKYVNSPESDIYNKSKVLYGIYQGRNAIINKDNCFLVEGYTDVISLHQAGIENVVSSSGTSLTTDQIKLIKRFTKNITILYDGDAAGIKASFRGIDMILEEGMNVKIVLFPEGEDPDSYARNHRTEEVENFVQKNAKDFISFKTDLLMQDAKNDPLKRASLIKEIVQTISLIPDGIFRSVYVRECSAIMNIQEQTLMNELNKLLRKKYNDKYKGQGFNSEEIPHETQVETPKIQEHDLYTAETQEREIVRLLLLYGNQEIIFEELNELQQKIEVPIKIAEYIVHDLKNDEIELQNPEYRLIINEYERALSQGFIPEENYFVQFEDQKVSKLAIDILSTPYELSGNWERNKIFVKTEQDNLLNLVSSSVMSYKSKKLDQMILENQKELKETKDEEDYLILMQKLISLKQVSIEINKQLSRIITK